MLRPEIDDLDVRKAHPDRVVSNQELVRTVGGHRRADGAARGAQLVEALAVKRPKPHFVGNLGVNVPRLRRHDIRPTCL